MNTLTSMVTSNKIDGPGLDESYLVGEVKNFKDIIKCSICLTFPLKHTTCRYCKSIFCKYCISQWLEENSTCPSCRDFFVESELDRYTSALINKFKLKCINTESGCNEEIFLEKYEDHYITHCKYTVYTCEFCYYKGNIDVMIAHYCEVQCPYCEINYNRWKQNDHNKKCKRELCEYCGKIFSKNKIKEHIEFDCDEIVVECDMCNFMCGRKNLQEHRCSYHLITKK
jgi:hypothetical protein